MLEYLHSDVGNEENWQNVTEYITEKYRRLNILINNAGVTGFLETKGAWDAKNADLQSLEEIHRVNAK